MLHVFKNTKHIRLGMMLGFLPTTAFSKHIRLGMMLGFLPTTAFFQTKKSTVCGGCPNF